MDITTLLNPEYQITTMEEMHMLARHNISAQHETFTDTVSTLDDRITYFLDYNVSDSDVSDTVEFVVESERLLELLDLLQYNGCDLRKCYNDESKPYEVTDGFFTNINFEGINMWYHDRLKYFGLELLDYDYNVFRFVDITYEQMKQTLIGGFEKGIITDITHPCWKF